MRYPIAPQGLIWWYQLKPMVRFELTTLCLQSRCNNHYATSACHSTDRPHTHMPEVGFEPTHPKIIELKSTALDRSAIQACMYVCHHHTTAAGFEPARAEPNRFRIYRLNHSAMLPPYICLTVQCTMHVKSAWCIVTHDMIVHWSDDRQTVRHIWKWVSECRHQCHVTQTHTHTTRCMMQCECSAVRMMHMKQCMIAKCAN